MASPGSQNRQLRKEMIRKISILEGHKAQQIAKYDMYVAMARADDVALSVTLQDKQDEGGLYAETHLLALEKRYTANIGLLNTIREAKAGFINEIDPAIADMQQQLQALG